jgi:phosphoglycolate phosphatase-like HAD superfamily hydrolase
MWRKLEAHYDDASASVQAALAGLQRLKHVESEDYRAIIELVNEVEAAYCQLQELDHLGILTVRDVDHISEFLQSHVRVEWIRK